MKSEDLISEVAKRRGILVERTDPAILLGTVLELHLERASKEIAAMLEAGADQTAAATVAQVDAAKQVAQVIVTQSAEWIAKQIDTMMVLHIEKMGALLEGHQVRLRACQNRALWAAAVAGSSAVIALGILVWFLSA